jgi:hypothetical protein
MNAFFALTLTIAAFFTNSKSSGPTLPAGTILHARLDETVSTTDARVGERFTFHVAAPYPRNARGLAGARISAYVTDITRPGNGRRARIGLVFAHIIFAHGDAEPITAYVDDPAFTRREPGDFAPRDIDVANPSGSRRVPMLGGRLQNQTLAEVTFGPKASQVTGAYVYAARGGAELVLPENQAYNVELARGLPVP